LAPALPERWESRFKVTSPPVPPGGLPKDEFMSMTPSYAPTRSGLFALPQHHRAFVFTVAWTLSLLWLGSIVHVTESSLACPDWPTCFGSFVPEMSGGVFWEHLHRLVAGGLVLIFSAATFLTWKEEGGRSWLWKTGLAGIGMLLVQSVLGGLTVIMQLPTAISSSHLTLAFIFLGLSSVLMVATSPAWGGRAVPAEPVRALIRRGGAGVVGLVYVQSVLGALVRHTGAGMACPDAPLCLGEVVPPLDNPLIALHFVHRVTGVILAVATFWFAIRLLRDAPQPRFRKVAWGLMATVTVQIALGFAAVLTIRDLIPTSLHTLGAAILVMLALMATTWGYERPVGGATRREPSGTMAGAAGR